MADIAPPELRGAAFGLRQSLDTVGAFVGPLLAVGADAAVGQRLPRRVLGRGDARACSPWRCWSSACASRERAGRDSGPRIRSAATTLRRLGGAYWWVVGVGAVFTLARFSEAFLVLRAQQGGVPIAWCRW